MKPGMGWPIGVAVILSATVVANIVVMRIANNDPSFAIEPDYYQKAVAFDSTMATEARSLALDWHASTSIVATDSGGRPTLTVVLLGADRTPVVGATVHVTALANARANHLMSSTLRESAPGRYEGPLAAVVHGQWEVRIDATRGAEHFVTSTRTDFVRVAAR